MGGLLQDVRFAVRAIRARPGLTLAAALSLGLGIGANTIVFTWMERFVLRPLPAVQGYGRLVAVRTHAPGDQRWSLSYPSFRDWRAQSRTVDLAVSRFFQGGLRSQRGIDRVWAQAVSANYFDVLKVRPLLGRGFHLDEETQAAPVAVLGYGLWRERFAGDSGIVGRSLILNGHPLTVIGVAPPDFGGTIVGLAFDIYFPLTLEPALTGRRSWLEDRGWQSYEGVGRLRDGVTLAQAREELDAVALRVAAESGDPDVKGAYVLPFGELGGPSILRPALSALLGVTVVVLLIACANVASLLLARALARRREIGIRLALGASRWRLVRQLLTESLVLAVLAGGIGLLVAAWGRNLMYAFVPAAPFPINFQLTFTNRVFAFTALLTGVTALCFGLLPALQSSRPQLAASLKDEIGDGRPRRFSLQSGLVIGQLALSVLSLVAAGLFVRSLQSANRVDLGFAAPHQVLLVSTDVTLAGYTDSAAIRVIGNLLERVRAVPGVEAAGAASMVPLGFGGSSSSGTEIEGYTPAPEENTSIERSTVTPGYFEAMGIPILRGRSFGAEDEGGRGNVAIVNQAFVDRYWPGQDPLGRRLRQGGAWLTVVGVARTGKYHDLAEAPNPVVYRVLGEGRDLYLTTHIRVKGAPDDMVPVLRETFAAAGRDIPFLDVRTMAENMGASLFARRMAAWMLAAFGGVALVLSSLGIYGVLSHLVSRRTREIGVRLALGASRGEVMGMVLRRAGRQVAIGLLLGAGLALAAGRLLRSQLLGVSPADPVTYTTIALLLGGVALVASWLPARRAATVDPTVALRAD
jgi:predicted permease